MRGLNARLATLKRDRANPLVAFGETPVNECDCELVPPGWRLETDAAQAIVDPLDGRVELLVDRFVVRLAADSRAKELLAVKQGEHGIFELHSRHFAGERHVADREFVLAGSREIVFDSETAASPERQAGNVVLLPTAAGFSARRQRYHHVGNIAVGRRDRRCVRVANRLDRDGSRSGDVLIDECGRHLQGIRVVVEKSCHVVYR